MLTTSDKVDGGCGGEGGCSQVSSKPGADTSCDGPWKVAVGPRPDRTLVMRSREDVPVEGMVPESKWEWVERQRNYLVHARIK